MDCWLDIKGHCDYFPKTASLLNNIPPPCSEKGKKDFIDKEDEEENHNQLIVQFLHVVP